MFWQNRPLVIINDSLPTKYLTETLFYIDVLKVFFVSIKINSKQTNICVKLLVTCGRTHFQESAESAARLAAYSEFRGEYNDNTLFCRKVRLLTVFVHNLYVFIENIYYWEGAMSLCKLLLSRSKRQFFFNITIKKKIVKYAFIIKIKFIAKLQN